MAIRSFGLVVVVTAGTPVRLTTNITGSAPAAGPTARQGVQSFMVQAHPDNTGKVYVFAGNSNFSGDHRTDLVSAIGVLPPPADPDAGPFPAASWGVPNASAGINMADIWVDAEMSGDGVIVSATIQ